MTRLLVDRFLRLRIFRKSHSDRRQHAGAPVRGLMLWLVEVAPARGLMLWLVAVAVTLSPRVASAQTVLFSEGFEDADLGSRDWYDVGGVTLSTTEHIPGSTSSYECRFVQGATGCSGGNPGRRTFPARESIYLSFYIKHSVTWVGSDKSYHPHMFYFMTDENDAYVGPAYTHLTAYIEENEGYPQLAIQDGQNIDESQIGQDLIGVTEARSVAGCNGVATNIGASHIDCYSVSANTHWNGIAWKGPSPVFFDATPGPTFKGDWHRVEAYFQLNSIAGGVGMADGVVQYWYDGQLVIDHHNVILRTGQHASMKFNQLLMAFYIGDGSPVEQTLWIDDLTVGTVRPTTPPPTDAGPPTLDQGTPRPEEAGPPIQEAGPQAQEAGSQAQEAGSPRDGSPSLMDASSLQREGRSTEDLAGGCGCRAAPAGVALSGLGWILAAVGLFLNSRRREG